MIAFPTPEDKPTISMKPEELEDRLVDLLELMKKRTVLAEHFVSILINKVTQDNTVSIETLSFLQGMILAYQEKLQELKNE